MGALSLGCDAAGQGVPLCVPADPVQFFVRCLVSRMYVLLAFVFFFKNGKQD